MANAISTLSMQLVADTGGFSASMQQVRKDIAYLKSVVQETEPPNQKLARQLQILDALYQDGKVSISEYARAADKLQDEFDDPGGKRKRYLSDLESEVRLLKMSTAEKRQAQYAQAGLNKEQVKAAEALHAEKEALQSLGQVGSQGMGAGGFAKGKAVDSLGLGEFVAAGEAAGPAGIAIAGGLAVATTAAVAFGVAAKTAFDVTMDGIERLNKLNDEAKALDLPVTQLQQLQNQAKLAGAPVESVTQALMKMESVLGDPTDATLNRFDKMGLSVDKLRQDGLAAFGAIATEIDKLPTRAEQLAAIEDIFGRGNRELINLIDNWQGFSDKAASFTLTESQFAAIGSADDALDELELSFEGVKNVIAAELAPIVTDVASSISEFLQQDGTQEALLASLYLVRDTLQSIDDTATGAAASLDAMNQGGVLSGLFSGLTGNITQPFQDLAAAEMEAARLDRELKKKQAKDMSADGSEFTDVKSDEFKKTQDFQKKLLELREEARNFGNEEAKMRADAVKAGAVNDDQIAAYVALQKQLKDLKQAQDDLRDAEKKRADQAKKDADDLAKLQDKVMSPLDKARSEYKRAAELGLAGLQLDAFAGTLIKDLVPNGNMGPVTGFQKGSKEALAFDQATERARRQEDLLKQIRDALKQQLREPPIEVVEQSI